MRSCGVMRTSGCLSGDEGRRLALHRIINEGISGLYLRESHPSFFLPLDGSNRLHGYLKQHVLVANSQVYYYLVINNKKKKTPFARSMIILRIGRICQTRLNCVAREYNPSSRSSLTVHHRV